MTGFDKFQGKTVMQNDYTISKQWRQKSQVNKPLITAHRGLKNKYEILSSYTERENKRDVVIYADSHI